MSGWVTERDFEAAEEAFPGIRAFWEALAPAARPKTFLELLNMFMKSEAK